MPNRWSYQPKRHQRKSYNNSGNKRSVLTNLNVNVQCALVLLCLAVCASIVVVTQSLVNGSGRGFLVLFAPTYNPRESSEVAKYYLSGARFTEKVKENQGKRRLDKIRRTKSMVKKTVAVNLASFMEDREGVYRERRKNVKSACRKLRENGLLLPFDYLNKTGSLGGGGFTARAMMHEMHSHNVAYCQIAKAASSTWTRNMMVIGGQKPKKKNHIIAPKMFQPQFDDDGRIVGVNSSTISLVFVRHPFSRLVSTYYSKFVVMGFSKWDVIRQGIIQHFREGGTDFLLTEDKWEGVKFDRPEDDPRIPTPTEFLQFVLWSLAHGDIYTPDAHWIPQHKACPFCQFNFTVYGKLETYELDSKYFLLKSGLSYLIDPDVKLNTIQEGKSSYYRGDRDSGDRSRRNNYKGGRNNAGSHDRDRLFWSSVPRWAVEATAEGYKWDLKMFGYSVEEYFREIGLEEQYLKMV